MPLFEIAVILEPTKKDMEKGALEELILGPETLIAKNQETAGMSVLMNNAEKLKAYDPSLLKVLIRPFA